MPLSKQTITNLASLAADHLRGRPLPDLNPQQMAGLWSDVMAAQEFLQAPLIERADEPDKAV